MDEALQRNAKFGGTEVLPVEQLQDLFEARAETVVAENADGLQDSSLLPDEVGLLQLLLEQSRGFLIEDKATAVNLKPIS